MIDREAQPWARARTCSDACARRAGHLRRRPDNAHRQMVQGYHLQRDTDLRQREVMCADEDLVPVVFKTWLTDYEWETEMAA